MQNQIVRRGTGGEFARGLWRGVRWREKGRAGARDDVSEYLVYEGVETGFMRGRLTAVAGEGPGLATGGDELIDSVFLSAIDIYETSIAIATGSDVRVMRFKSNLQCSPHKPLNHKH